jgi:hypothetical protein
MDFTVLPVISYHILMLISSWRHVVVWWDVSTKSSVNCFISLASCWIHIWNEFSYSSFHTNETILWKLLTNLCLLIPFHHSSQPRLLIWWKGFGKKYSFGCLGTCDQLHRARVLFMVRALEYFFSPPLSEQFQDPLTLPPAATVNTFDRPWCWLFTHRAKIKNDRSLTSTSIICSL